MKTKKKIKLTRSPIFSGQNSTGMWESINSFSVKEDENLENRLWDALYTIGCRCQELETVVDNLERRIIELENK